MRQNELAPLFQRLLPIANAAGEAVMDVYASGKTWVRAKEDLSPVTKADMAAHQILAQRLALLMPGCPVISEESIDSHLLNCDTKLFWLIDPLDGTKEFINRCNEFTVNIALISERRSILGVVVAPAIGATYWGGLKFGAFRQIGGRTELLKVTCGKTEGLCRVLASKSHMTEETQVFIDRLGETHLANVGSSLKICRIAEGLADIYPRLAPTSEWDTAAAQAVLEGAGGVVLDLQGCPLVYGKQDMLNPSFVAARDAMLIP